MLSISKPFKGAGRADYYLNLAQEDYYLSGLEPAGFWLGEGAVKLGLLGHVSRDAFCNLLSGMTPDGKRPLVHNANSDHRRSGWDLTWSAPKSVSALWSQAGKEIRAQIELDLCNSVRRATEYLATVGVVSRRGSDGVVRETAQLAFACFEHSTSRALDPQLHVHSILINLGIRPDGSTGTLEPRELYRHQMAAGALFRAELAARLEQSLGLRARRADRCFELIGVPAVLIETFSKRRAQIEARLKELGVNTPAAAEMAALTTRSVKEQLSREQLLPQWREVGLAHNWGEKEIAWLLQYPFPVRNFASEAKESRPLALSALTVCESHFGERQLLQALAEEAQGRGLDADRILELRSQVLASTQVIPLNPIKGAAQWTTPEMLRLEARALNLAQAMSARERVLPYTIVERADESIKLSKEQKNALEHVVSSAGGIRIISGMAGTGKSTVFRAAREVWMNQGREVIGMCLAGKAACELTRATGIAAQTLQRTLMQWDRSLNLLGRHSVVLVDEAGMVGTRQMALLLDHCHRSGATLVLCGDARQLQPIEAGGVFQELTARCGSADLVDIRRQREEWARAAVVAFAEGRADDALTAHEERGGVSMSQEGLAAIENLCSQHADMEAKGEQSLVLANRVEDAQSINRRIQQSRLEAGHLLAPGIAVADFTLHVGERILFTKNSAPLGVWNGQVGKVVALTPGRVTVKLDSKSQVTFNPATYPHIQLGYALTTHKAQALTVESTQIYADATAENREAAYVQASRARGKTHFHVVAENRDQLVASMERSRPKVMATTLLPDNETGPRLSLRLEL